MGCRWARAPGVSIGPVDAVSIARRPSRTTTSRTRLFFFPFWDNIREEEEEEEDVDAEREEDVLVVVIVVPAAA